MKNNFFAFIVGLSFAIGLAVSGMTQPAKVIGFLDIFGNWDPSLMFVMIGAIAVHSVIYKLIRKRPTPILAKEWQVPNKKDITPSLVIGSLIFGVGWGLGGFCPGPGLTSLASFEITPVVFVLSMIAGIFIFKVLDTKFGFKR